MLHFVKRTKQDKTQSLSPDTTEAVRQADETNKQLYYAEITFLL